LTKPIIKFQKQRMTPRTTTMTTTSRLEAAPNESGDNLTPVEEDQTAMLPVDQLGGYRRERDQ
jgi:hypothetical protein